MRRPKLDLIRGDLKEEWEALGLISYHGTDDVMADLNMSDVEKIRSLLKRADTALGAFERRLKHSETHRQSNRRTMRQRGRTIERLCTLISNQKVATGLVHGNHSIAKMVVTMERAAELHRSLREGRPIPVNPCGACGHDHVAGIEYEDAGCRYCGCSTWVSPEIEWENVHPGDEISLLVMDHGEGLSREKRKVVAVDWPKITLAEGARVYEIDATEPDNLNRRLMRVTP